MKIKYVGTQECLGLVVGDTYEVIEGPDSTGSVTIRDQDGSPLWLLSSEIEVDNENS